MLLTSHLHFFFLRNKSCFCRMARTSCVVSLWSWGEVDIAIRISSIYMMIFTPLFSHFFSVGGICDSLCFGRLQENCIGQSTWPLVHIGCTLFWTPLCVGPLFWCVPYWSLPLCWIWWRWRCLVLLLLVPVWVGAGTGCRWSTGLLLGNLVPVSGCHQLFEGKRRAKVLVIWMA